MPRDSAGHLIPGTPSPQRPVPRHIARPEYVGKPGPQTFAGSDVYSPAEIERVRTSGRIAAQAVEAVGAAIRPGVTTDELDRVAHDFLIAHDAYPSTLGYRGFPKSCCTSINEVICHGIPDDTVLVDGDIINIDITAFHDGMHGDLNKTFLVGDVAPETVDLVERTREALNRGIKAVAPGRPVNVIGRAIESYAKRFGYGVVRDFTGRHVDPVRDRRAQAHRAGAARAQRHALRGRVRRPAVRSAKLLKSRDIAQYRFDPPRRAVHQPFAPDHHRSIGRGSRRQRQAASRHDDRRRIAGRLRPSGSRNGQ